MSCYHPLKAMKVTDLKTGEFIKMEWINFVPEKKRDIIIKGKTKYLEQYTEVPCGTCVGCRMQYAENWAMRCVLEARQWKHNNVLTLTYDPEHLPLSKGIDFKTGEVKDVPTLKPKDVQLFFKRFRKQYAQKYGQDNIRFFDCGEYGDKNGRPHYHVILYNCNIPDKTFFKYNQNGYKLYRSKEITKIWGMGSVEINDLSYEMCAYIARYVLKKQKGHTAKETYLERGQVPEFTNMSRKPGIAYKYFEQKKETIYATQEIFIQTQKTLKKYKPPRYFDNLLQAEDEEAFKKIKAKRKNNAEDRKRTVEHLIEYDVDKYNELLEESKIKQLNKLPRSYEQS